MSDPEARLEQLREVLLKKGVSQEDSQEFVDCIRILGTAASGKWNIWSEAWTDVLKAGVRIDEIIDKYPSIQRETASELQRECGRETT